MWRQKIGDKEGDSRIEGGVECYQMKERESRREGDRWEKEKEEEEEEV